MTKRWFKRWSAPKGVPKGDGSGVPITDSDTDADTDSDTDAVADEVAEFDVLIGDPAAAPSVADETALDRFAKNRPWFLNGTIVSGLGNSMSWMATSYVIYVQTSSVAISALVTVCSSVPSLLLGGVATKIAGKWNEAKLFVVSGCALGILGFLPVIMSVTGNLNTGNLLVWQLGIGIIIGLSAPAGAMITRFLAPPDGVPEFNAQITRAKAISSVIGLLLGGAIYAAVGPTWVYLFNALSYFAPALAVIPLVKRAATPKAQTKMRAVIALRKEYPGLSGVFRACVASCVVGSFSVALPALGATIGKGAWILSVLQASFVVGGLFVVVMVKRLHGHIGWGRVQRLCLLAMAVGLLLLAWVTRIDASPSRVFVFSVLLLIVVGYAIATETSVLSAVVQVHAPEEHRGSVLTAYHMIPMAFVPISQEIVGFVTDYFTLAGGFSFCAICALIAIVIGPRMGVGSAINKLDETTDIPPVTAVVPHASGPDDRPIDGPRTLARRR